jgi:hypothetical protein
MSPIDPGNVCLSTTRSTAVLMICLAPLALAACGAGRSAKVNRTQSALQATCLPAARQAIARAISVGSAGIGELRSKGNNGYPQCLFQARLPSGARFHALVNVDTGPSPYFVVDRTIEEDAQVFTPKPLYPPPLSISGVGLEAAWFPQYPYLLTTDGFRMLAVTVVWPHHTQRSERALAIAIVKPYLHTPHGKLAERLAHMYP